MSWFSGPPVVAVEAADPAFTSLTHQLQKMRLSPLPVTPSGAADPASSGALLDEKKTLRSTFMTEAKASKLSVITTYAKPLSARKGQALASGNQPPLMDAAPYKRHTFRFRAVAATTGSTITVGNILAACGGVGTVSNSTITGFCSSFRLKRIRAWAVSNVSASASNADILSVAWLGSTSNERDQNMVTSQVGVAQSLYMDTLPPQGTLASFWWGQAGIATQLFNLVSPIGAIIDVDLEFTQLTDLNTVGVNYTGFAAVTVGGVYYGYLDGKSGSNFVPIGLQSAT
jgi:hypothetical protein